MDFAEEEAVLKKLMEKILWEKLSAKCPFSCIIMEKGGYWVGVCLFVCFVTMLCFYSLSFSFYLSIWFLLSPIACEGSYCLSLNCILNNKHKHNLKHKLLFFVLCYDWVFFCFGTGWWGKLHLISVTSGSLKNQQNVNPISLTTGRVHLMLYAFSTLFYIQSHLSISLLTAW